LADFDDIRGKATPLLKAKGESPNGAVVYMHWFADRSASLEWRFDYNICKDKRILTIKNNPLVCRATYNHELSYRMITRKGRFQPARRPGCTIVIQPSDETPLLRR